MNLTVNSSVCVGAGYELQSAVSPEPLRKQAMLAPEALSRKRQLVEQLDSGAVLDYLHQNGALSQQGERASMAITIKCHIRYYVHVPKLSCHPEYVKNQWMVFEVHKSKGSRRKN